MIPNLGGLSLRRCAHTAVNFQDTQQAICLMCLDVMHAPLSNGLQDPRLGLAELKSDTTALQRWSWATAVLRCGHRFHRRCLAQHFGPYGQAANQNPRLCPAGADQHNPPTPLSETDNADIDTDIDANMDKDTPLDGAETQRFEDGEGVVERGGNVTDVPALRAQAQTAQEEARAANSRYRDVQNALEDAKKDYEALKAQAMRLAQQRPPPLTRQSSAEALALKDNVVTLQELLRQQQREMDDLRSEKMVRENADAEMVNEANRLRTAQGMEAERLRRQYALELDHVARLEADQRRLDTSLETLKRQLRADESDLARVSDLEAERDELQRALVVARSSLHKFRENAKSSAVAYKAKTSEELEELRKKVQTLKVQLQSETEPAPEPAPEPGDPRRMEVLPDADDEGRGEGERYTPPSPSSSPPPPPPPPPPESTSSGNSEADRYIERERQPEQSLEANRPKTEAEKTRERKQKAKAVRDSAEWRKVKQERDQAAARARARELAEAEASAERQKEANRKLAEEKKRAKAEAQAEREAAVKAFKAKQKQPKEATAPISENYVMVPTFEDKRLCVRLREMAIADIRDLEEDFRQLVAALKNFVTITPGGILDSIEERLKSLVGVTPTLFSVLDNTDLLTRTATVDYFTKFLDAYAAMHRNAGLATTELKDVAKFLASATPTIADAEAHKVARERENRLKRSCIRLQRHVWSLLSLFFTREGLGIISTRWKLHAVMVDVEPPEAVAAQADRE